MPPVAVRDEEFVCFGDLPTDQAWRVRNLINALLIQTTMDGEEGGAWRRSAELYGAPPAREPWPELSEEDAKRLNDAYRGEF
jgi:enoyl-CoA hydratase/E-phenylitaconyl-CoA hydratase/naphthyl-2-hydroxymethylsuccinyl-CoA hydratase